MAWEPNYEIKPATALGRALRDMLQRANDTGQEVRAEFNSRQLTARPGGTIDELDEQWDLQTKAIHDASELERVTRAHQVACFPDLLDALRELVADYRGVCSNLPFGMTSKAETERSLKRALAAIARAEGPPAPKAEADGPAF